MDILINVISGFIVEVGKFVCKCIYPDVENTVHFSSNVENLRDEMEKLMKLRDDIKGKVEIAEGEGYKPKPDVIKWIEDVCELENEWETMQQNIASAKTLVYRCCPNCSLRSQVWTQAHNSIQVKLCSLKNGGESFGSNLMEENYRTEKVEHLPGPSIKDQPAARKNLDKILQHLESDEVGIIGVWGAGGIGKTTLVKNLNNELKQMSKLCFGVVIWVTVPKPPIDIRKVQAQIADRLSLEVNTDEGSVESNASKIYQRLKQEKSFLVILDDVWEAIDLDHVGVPQPRDHAGSNVIITSRKRKVCEGMKTHTIMNIFTLDEDESWHLFIENAGDVANRVDIQPLAMGIAKECGGLPLAITIIGASMRGKNMVEEWEDALESLRMSEPNDKDTGDKVYQVIKWSFDSLEQRGNRSDIQSCFLYCSLYPESIPTDDLIHCWWAEGFLGDTYEKAYNRGITIIEELKNVCLLEEAHDEMDCVKMHDVVRDVAKWIDNTFGDEHTSVIQAGIELIKISNVELVSASVKRLSFITQGIQYLPDNFTECPKTTSLLLQDNKSLMKIPDKFFLSFPVLRVLNLSYTRITVLPSSVNNLSQLRALILKYCYALKELPAIGNLCNLQLLDCDRTWLGSLPEGMDKLTNLRLLNMPLGELKESIDLGVFHELQGLEMLHLPLRRRDVVGATSFDEISHLPNLTSLFIYLDSSSISILKSDHTWMKRLKTFHITVGNTTNHREVPFNYKSTREICLSGFDLFNNKVLLSSMLQFASNLYLERCMGLTEFIRNNSFDGLKSLYIFICSDDFGSSIEGRRQFDDPLPNLEHLSFDSVHHLKSVSDFGHFLGLRFSKLRRLDISNCDNLTCLFNVGGAFSVPRHLEDISLSGYWHNSAQVRRHSLVQKF